LAIVDTVNPVIELTEAGELPYYRGFFERLRQLGFAEGQNLQIKRYSGEGQSERFDDMVSQVVNLKPDAIFVTSTRLLSMLKGATTTIPLVGLMGDPIRFGLTASMALRKRIAFACPLTASAAWRSSPPSAAPRPW
jgi:putative ABC transport system substrate-binding protein